MSYRVCETLETEKQAIWDVYCQTMISLTDQNNRIVVVDADLMNSVGTVPFGETHPKRTANCDIQEASMIGVVADMPAVGMVPYCRILSCPTARRYLDQIFVFTASVKANIRTVGSDPSVAAAMNGAIHTLLKDVGSLRDIPEVTVIEPTNSIMLDSVIRQLERANDVYYVRPLRKDAVQIYQPGSIFKIRKTAELCPGTDVTLMATSVCMAETLEATDQLTRKGISAATVNMPTPRPIDRDAVERYTRSIGAIVTAKSHSIYNGLGSTVAEVVAGTCLVSLGRVGVLDWFGQVDTVDYLREIYQLGVRAIYEEA